MSIHRSPRVDRDAAEHLVAGKGVGPVASVLRAAAAPAHRNELAGEDAAVAAFRTAATAAPARQPVFPRAVAKALTIKVAIVLAIAGSTGVVLAASEGALPVPWSNSPVDQPATTTTTPPAPSSPGARTSDGRQPPANPDPAIVGLCEAYLAHDDRNLDNPAFRALVEAAGGKAEVNGYCELVEATKPSPSAEPGPPNTTARPGEPGSKPATPPANPPTMSDQPGPGERPGVTDPPTEPDQPARPSKTRKEPTSEPTVEDAVTTTPGSPAPGAATAVPPSGAEPPSTGG
jgi:hypothetical protein